MKTEREILSLGPCKVFIYGIKWKRTKLLKNTKYKLFKCEKKLLAGLKKNINGKKSF